MWIEKWLKKRNILQIVSANKIFKSNPLDLSLIDCLRYCYGPQRGKLPMAPQPLISSTGSLLADRTIRGIVHLFESLLPGRICSWYVEGSYATQSAVDTSDLDLILVLHAPLVTEEEQTIIANLLEACQYISSLELDITVTDLETLQRSADSMFKLGARLLAGTEIRDTIPLIPIALWARQRMHAAFWLRIHVFNRPEPVVAPIPFPDSADKFYGYAARRTQRADGTEVLTTRDLIRVTGWIATARIAYQAQQYVVDKRSCVATYRDVIGDEWTDLLVTIDQRCWRDWHYLIPGNKEEQEELQAICRHVLAYENHFLTVYDQFLADEFTSKDTCRHGSEATSQTMVRKAKFKYNLKSRYPFWPNNAGGRLLFLSERSSIPVECQLTIDGGET